jgi:hypothetical protein
MSLNSRIAPIEQLEEVDEDEMHHDVGFLWQHLSVLYRLWLELDKAVVA